MKILIFLIIYILYIADEEDTPIINEEVLVCICINSVYRTNSEKSKLDSDVDYKKDFLCEKFLCQWVILPTFIDEKLRIMTSLP